MAEIDLDDRTSLEHLYPLDAFEHDAAQNSLASASVRHGLRILSGADAAGHVEIARVRQQAAERDPEGDTIFLAPQTTSGAPATGAATSDRIRPARLRPGRTPTPTGPSSTG